MFVLNEIVILEFNLVFLIIFMNGEKSTNSHGIHDILVSAIIQKLINVNLVLILDGG